MEAYALALTFAIPGFVLLIIIESIAGKIMGVKVNNPMDTIASLSSGMTNTLKAFMGLSVVILSYGWMVEHFAVFEIQSTPWLYVLAFIGHDFAGYWGHRFNHVVNAFWNRHIAHHASEEFNLACALRQTIATFAGIYFFLYIPMAIIGIPAEIVGLVAPIHLFAQFWYHTRLINRMGFLEHIIVTPSHHRVHHAINDEYIDKNFSEIFIVWDKWFGTFQEELPDVEPVYGTKKPVNTWNPLIINFMHISMILRDAWYTKNWWDKIRIFFMPTGWRPEDVKDRFPIEVVNDVYARPKYNSHVSLKLRNWSWAQLVIHNLLMFYVLANIATFPYVDVLWYVSFLMVSIFAYTALMDRHPYAVAGEAIKLVFGIFLLYKMGGWYDIDALIPGGTWLVGGYFILSFALALYFDQTERRAKTLSPAIQES